MPTGLLAIFFIVKIRPFQPDAFLAYRVTVPNNVGGSPTTGYFLLLSDKKQAEMDQFEKRSFNAEVIGANLPCPRMRPGMLRGMGSGRDEG
jgi:hypothetical protein